MVGIIGGADGPTAIFVTSTMGDNLTVLVIIVAATAVMLAVGWLCHRKRKPER